MEHPRISGLFPQTFHALETGALVARTEVPPDPDAPLRSASGVDTSTWTIVRQKVGTGPIQEMLFPLPPDFWPPGAARDVEAVAFGPRLGYWSAPLRHAPGRPNQTANLSFMLMPVASHVTIGTSLDTTQISLEECRIEGAAGTLHLLEFTLHDPNFGTSHWLSGLWEIGPGAWLLAEGSAPEERDRGDLRAALEGLRFIRR